MTFKLVQLSFAIKAFKGVGVILVDKSLADYQVSGLVSHRYARSYRESRPSQ